MQINQIPISFEAKIGPRLKEKVEQEYGGDREKCDKFDTLFYKAYSKIMDDDTVVDIDDKGCYVYSNLLFPNITYDSDSKLNTDKPLIHVLLMECTKTFATDENKLFKNVVRDRVETVGFNALEEEVNEKVENPKTKEGFEDLIRYAKRIKEMDPDSELSSIEFDTMMNIMDTEDLNTPGTKLYEEMRRRFHRLGFFD